MLPAQHRRLASLRPTYLHSLVRNARPPGYRQLANIYESTPHGSSCLFSNDLGCHLMTPTRVLISPNCTQSPEWNSSTRPPPRRFSSNLMRVALPKRLANGSSFSLSVYCNASRVEKICRNPHGQLVIYSCFHSLRLDDLQDIDYAHPVVFIELDEEMPGVGAVIERALNNE